MDVVWISGWGVAPESWRPLAEELLPGAKHLFLPPLASAPEAAAQAERVIAWSLGAWRVLEAASRGVSFRGSVSLLAPFGAFCSEYHLGGRCSQGQVRWLRRWVQREPAAALQDFYQRAGLGQAPAHLPYGLEDLLEGLERLAEDASPALRQFLAQGLPATWKAIIGELDPLLEARAVAQSLPGCQVAPGTGHQAQTLLKAMEPLRHAL